LCHNLSPCVLDYPLAVQPCTVFIGHLKGEPCGKSAHPVSPLREEVRQYLFWCQGHVFLLGFFINDEFKFSHVILSVLWQEQLQGTSPLGVGRGLCLHPADAFGFEGELKRGLYPSQEGVCQGELQAQGVVEFSLRE